MEYTDPVRPAQQPWMWCGLTLLFSEGRENPVCSSVPQSSPWGNDYEILKRGKRIKVYEYTHIHTFLKSKITRG